MGDVIDISGRHERHDPGEPVLDALAQRVVAVIAHQTGQRVERIELDSQLERDLGCTGDDAWELMGRMASEFGIDMRGFNFDRHFGNEGGLGWPIAVALVVAVPVSIIALQGLGLVWRVTGYSGQLAADPRTLLIAAYIACALLILAAMTLLPQARIRRARRIPITVNDLVEAARTRRFMLDITEKHTS